MGKSSAIINVAIWVGMLGFGLVFASFVSLQLKSQLVLAIGLSSISVLLLVVAKLPKLRQRELLSPGVGGFVKRRPFYVAAYLALGAGIAAWVSMASSAGKLSSGV